MTRMVTSVSLIISVYNRDDFLRLVLESVLRQNYPLKEVIITEDGECDPIKKVISEFSPRSNLS